MFVADKLRKSNRSEYLLYLWQVEDLIRAYNLDADRISQEYICRFELPKEQLDAMSQWYANLCEMMRSEGKGERGHLQICKNVLQELIELHTSLLASAKYPYYRELYYKVLPYIVELRSKERQKSEGTEKSELETCFELLYGVLLLRLQHKTVAPQTEAAAKDISALLGQLSDYYFINEQKPLEF